MGRRMSSRAVSRPRLPIDARRARVGHPSQRRAPPSPGEENIRMAQTIEGFVGTSMDNARLSPIHYRVFGLIAAGYFFDVCDYVILGSLIPDMTRSGFATTAQIATVASATLLGL